MICKNRLKNICTIFAIPVLTSCLFLMLLYGCFYMDPKENMPDILTPSISEDVNGSVIEIETSEGLYTRLKNVIRTYNTMEIHLETNIENLSYSLFNGEKLINEGKASTIIKFEGLLKNTVYNMVLFSDKYKSEMQFTTDDTVTMRFGGDITMSEFFGDALDNYGVEYMWGNAIDLIRSADYSFFNLETSVSERGRSTKPPGFGFRSKPSHLDGLLQAGVNMVSLANNHVLDYGMDAFYDTLLHLQEKNISYVGAGENFNQAAKVLFEEINGVTLGFFAANEIIPDESWIATKNSGGIMPLNENYYEKLFEIISEAKKDCDFLIVKLHWGREYVNYPSNEQIKLARDIIDSGADMIVGSHPHVLQGVEYYNEGIIFYSIGNFVFYKNNYDSGLTGLFEVEIYKNEIISARIYPVFINDLKSNLLDSADKMYREIISNISKRSEIFGVMADDEGFLYSKK